MAVVVTGLTLRSAEHRAAAGHHARGSRPGRDPVPWRSPGPAVPLAHLSSSVSLRVTTLCGSVTRPREKARGSAFLRRPPARGEGAQGGSGPRRPCPQRGRPAWSGVSAMLSPPRPGARVGVSGRSSPPHFSASGAGPACTSPDLWPVSSSGPGRSQQGSEAFPGSWDFPQKRGRPPSSPARPGPPGPRRGRCTHSCAPSAQGAPAPMCLPRDSC